MRGPASSDLQRARADQVREPRPLIGIEQRVQIGERLEHRIAQTLGAAHPHRGCIARGLRVERRARDGVGEPGHGTPGVDLGLRALGLERVQDTGQLGDLVLVEVELVGEEAERAADAEGTGAEVAELSRRRLARAPLPGVAVAAPAAAAAAGMAAPVVVTAVVGAPPVHHPWVHDLSSRGGGTLPAGLSAWATCLTRARTLVLPGPESTGSGLRLRRDDRRGRRRLFAQSPKRYLVAPPGREPHLCSSATLHSSARRCSPARRSTSTLPSSPRGWSWMTVRSSCSGRCHTSAGTSCNPLWRCSALFWASRRGGRAAAWPSCSAPYSCSRTGHGPCSPSCRPTVS